MRFKIHITTKSKLNKIIDSSRELVFECVFFHRWKTLEEPRGHKCIQCLHHHITQIKYRSLQQEGHSDVVDTLRPGKQSTGTLSAAVKNVYTPNSSTHAALSLSGVCN